MQPDRPSEPSFARKIEALHRLLEEEGLTPAPVATFPPRPASGLLPLSSAQRRLWLLEQWQPGTPTYNLGVICRLAGDLSISVLNRTIAEIVRRHEALRTTFGFDGSEPFQRIAPAAEVRLPGVDLEGLSGLAREAELERLAAGEARQPFDLAAGPLWRITLVRLDRREHALLVTLHHIVSDGWSTGVLLREVEALYGAFSRQLPSPLPELAVQYADFALWQQQQWAGGALTAQLAFWRRQLADLPELGLPADRPRPAVASGRGGQLAVSLPAATAAGLREVGRRSGATLFMVLLAGFEALLHRYTGQSDLAVGTPVANRSRIELEDLIGFFVNTLVLRTRIKAEATFASLVETVREVSRTALENQDVPFDKLVEELIAERDASRSPFFQVLFALQSAPRSALQLPGLGATVLQASTGTAKFDLSLVLTEAEDGLSGFLEYSRDLFDAPTAVRMLGHLGRLLAGAAAWPESRIADLPLLSEAERFHLLCEWNDPLQEEGGGGCLHRGFEAWAARTPDAIAVTAEGGGSALTYGELDRRAGRLARRLRAAGVRTGDRVGLYAGRSPRFVVGILGILKAGAAYVPLDPSYPRERLELIVEDSAVSAVVIEEGLGAGLAAGSAVRLPLEETGDAAEPLTGGELTGNDDPDAPAYIIYTSGSTGRPKGVAVTHRNVTRLYAACVQLDFGRDDVWTLFHSFAFDFSVWEIWGALLYGGRLVVVPEPVRRSPAELLDLLDRERVSVLSQTPSAFRQLTAAAAEPPPGRLAALRWVILGGEAVSLPALAPWLERYGEDRPQLINMYGITETTVHVTFRRILRSDLAAPERSPVGRALADLRLYLLDARLAPVPIGVAGEICVGGAGLAQGYLGRPETTAERFVPDPFGARPGGRLYRSGDLARYRPDGEVDYLVRADRQVKVRGFRIEPAEIEAALVKHPAVREAAIVASGGPAEDTRLIAYLARAGASSPKVEELQRFLRDRLPEYMVPAAFVWLDALPLTPNGKVDRQALPAPDQARPELEDEYVPPKTVLEQVLAGIWREVLGLERIGTRDNFFSLGGDSIRSVRIVALAKERGLDISVQQLFRYRTIEELAFELELKLGVSSQDSEDELLDADSDLDGLLEEIEGLTEEAVHARLREAASHQKGVAE